MKIHKLYDPSDGNKIIGACNNLDIDPVLHCKPLKKLPKNGYKFCFNFTECNSEKEEIVMFNENHDELFLYKDDKFYEILN